MSPATSPSITDETEPKQKTTPRGKDKSGNPHEPIEIPVPKRAFLEKFVRCVAK
jgi:hypothetical protein